MASIQSIDLTKNHICVSSLLYYIPSSKKFDYIFKINQRMIIIIIFCICIHALLTPHLVVIIYLSYILVKYKKKP